VTACAVVIACLVCPGGASRAHAQEPATTRAEEAEALRRAKAEKLDEPPRPNKVETIVNYIEDSRLFPRIFNPPRGWFAQVGGLGEGNGFTMGGGYRQPTEVGVFTVRALGSFRESLLGGAEFTRNFLPREAGFVTASVVRRHEAAQRFYGTGPDSSKDDRTSFGLSALQIDLTTGIRVTSWLTGTAGVGFVNPDITESSESSRVPGTDVVYTEAELPGVGVQPDFTTVHLGAVVDTRRSRNPRRGGLYQAQIRRFGDREGGAYSFTSTRVDLQQFIPFWNESRVLALRLMAEHADGLGSAQVPFYVLPTLGGARSLRGYDRQRFRDRNVLLFSAEYRYEVNPFLMAAVFYDAGQVAAELDDLRLQDFSDNYGIGFRFGYSNAVALRADVAFGGEDPVRLIVGFSTSF
jgi:outer membrane protein assembly factor BamA